METIKEQVRAMNSRWTFARLMEKKVPVAKEIIIGILSHNSDGVPFMELMSLFRRKMPPRWKIPIIFSLGMGFDKATVFLIAIEDLQKEGRIREEAKIFYPR